MAFRDKPGSARYNYGPPPAMRLNDPRAQVYLVLWVVIRIPRVRDELNQVYDLIMRAPDRDAVGFSFRFWFRQKNKLPLFNSMLSIYDYEPGRDRLQKQCVCYNNAGWETWIELMNMLRV